MTITPPDLQEMQTAMKPGKHAWFCISKLFGKEQVQATYSAAVSYDNLQPYCLYEEAFPE